jgi:Rrf2 family transcriptional regulator, cysteine metabolism repressor
MYEGKQMRLSSKGRYALAAAVSMAQRSDSSEAITVIRISEKLGISKIYLEQVFSLLKRGGIVTSVKGASGGYLLARKPEKITVLDVLSALELSLFEKAEPTVEAKAPELDAAMRHLVFNPLDIAIREALQRTTLNDLVQEAEKRRDSQEYMFFI